jgi:hypothetical protein
MLSPRGSICAQVEQSGLSEILHVMQEDRISRDRCASLSDQRPADRVELMNTCKGVLKNAASGVLAAWPCSRTPPYAPLVQAAAALLDALF